jgi:hypothetical protein
MQSYLLGDRNVSCRRESVALSIIRIPKLPIISSWVYGDGGERGTNAFHHIANFDPHQRNACQYKTKKHEKV